MLRVLEFYSGIGGMHYAFKACGVPFEIVAALEINNIVNEIYQHNFPSCPLQQVSINGLSVADLEKYAADIYVMSPPCQPYTRQGNQAQSKDNRASSFLHFLQLLSKMSNLPKFILVENVKGFEISDTREFLLETLRDKKYHYQEFLLSPSQFGIPNSRLRYYLLASLAPLNLTLQSDQYEILEHIPGGKYENDTRTVGEFLACQSEEVNEFNLSEEHIQRHHRVLDIVNPKSIHSCCFTKGYGHYVKGTGSVFTTASEDQVADAFRNISQLPSQTESNDQTIHHQPITQDDIDMMTALKLRYFTPREVANLMCFPEDFTFPASTSRKQKYRVLGNSVNVHVISTLLRLLMQGYDVNSVD